MQICYEIIFPAGGRSGASARLYREPVQRWLVRHWGPPQHLAQARLRAIEEGLPVLRSTTNGISAVVDAHGMVRQHAPRGVAARLDGFVPPAHGPDILRGMGQLRLNGAQ
jgi:apolipoprotein N-acyltransferase